MQKQFAPSISFLFFLVIFSSIELNSSKLEPLKAGLTSLRKNVQDLSTALTGVSSKLGELEKKLTTLKGGLAKPAEVGGGAGGGGGTGAAAEATRKAAAAEKAKQAAAEAAIKAKEAEEEAARKVKEVEIRVSQEAEEKRVAEEEAQRKAKEAEVKQVTGTEGLIQKIADKRKIAEDTNLLLVDLDPNDDATDQIAKANVNFDGRNPDLYFKSEGKDLMPGLFYGPRGVELRTRPYDIDYKMPENDLKDIFFNTNVWYFNTYNILNFLINLDYEKLQNGTKVTSKDFVDINTLAHKFGLTQVIQWQEGTKAEGGSRSITFQINIEDFKLLVVKIRQALELFKGNQLLIKLGVAFQRWKIVLKKIVDANIAVDDNYANAYDVTNDLKLMIYYLMQEGFKQFVQNYKAKIENPGAFLVAFKPSFSQEGYTTDYYRFLIKKLDELGKSVGRFGGVDFEIVRQKAEEKRVQKEKAARKKERISQLQFNFMKILNNAEAAKTAALKRFKEEEEETRKAAEEKAVGGETQKKARIQVLTEQFQNELGVDEDLAYSMALQEEAEEAERQRRAAKEEAPKSAFYKKQHTYYMDLYHNEILADEYAKTAEKKFKEKEEADVAEKTRQEAAEAVRKKAEEAEKQKRAQEEAAKKAAAEEATRKKDAEEAARKKTEKEKAEAAEKERVEKEKLDRAKREEEAKKAKEAEEEKAKQAAATVAGAPKKEEERKKAAEVEGGAAAKLGAATEGKSEITLIPYVSSDNGKIVRGVFNVLDTAEQAREAVTKSFYSFNASAKLLEDIQKIKYPELNKEFTSLSKAIFINSLIEDQAKEINQSSGQQKLSFCNCTKATIGMRLAYILRFLNAVLEKNPDKNALYVHTEFAEDVNRGLQTYLVIYGLMQVGYKNIICNVIGLGDMKPLQEKLEEKLLNAGKKFSCTVIVKCYGGENGVESYINDKQAKKSNSFSMIDPEPVGKDDHLNMVNAFYRELITEMKKNEGAVIYVVYNGVFRRYVQENLLQKYNVLFFNQHHLW